GSSRTRWLIRAGTEVATSAAAINPSPAPREREGSTSATRVLHAAAEVFPWVKTGGLGDVIAALPPALAALEVDVRLVLPGFSGFLDAFELSEVARLKTPFAAERVRLALASLPGSGVGASLVEHPAAHDAPGRPEPRRA